MINQQMRNGSFTSSEIVALTREGKTKGTLGEKALTYIEETNFERKLGRCLTEDINARPLTWGKLVEQIVFEKLGLEYILTSNETVQHPTIPFWVGSKDGIKHDPGKTVIDIKAPLTLKSFCQLVDPLYKGLEGMAAMQYIRDNHKDGEKFYWQLVSNSIIDNTKYAELIVYMPYRSELQEIRTLAHQVSGEHMSRHYWIVMSVDDDLPFLIDEGYYKNINIIRFEVPHADKESLTEKVKRAGQMLIPYPGEQPELSSAVVSPKKIVLQKINA